MHIAAVNSEVTLSGQKVASKGTSLSPSLLFGQGLNAAEGHTAYYIDIQWQWSMQLFTGRDIIISGSIRDA